MKEETEKTIVVKADFDGRAVTFEYPKDAFGHATDEKPHIHNSKPHPSNNEKQCDLCGQRMVKHYHVCEECWKYMKESLLLTVRDLEKRVQELEKP